MNKDRLKYGAGFSGRIRGGSGDRMIQWMSRRCDYLTAQDSGGSDDDWCDFQGENGNAIENGMIRPVFTLVAMPNVV